MSSANYNKRYLRGDGQVVWTRINLSLIRETNAEPGGLIATIEDVTEQLRTQAALEEREQRLRLICESISDYAIVTVDPAGIVTGRNSGAEQIFGYAASEIIGQLLQSSGRKKIAPQMRPRRSAPRCGEEWTRTR